MLGWPFVGRRQDLARAAAALDAGRPVVLVGAAGVGKSRLALEVLDRVGPRRVLGLVRATASARELPYGALLGLLPEVPADLTGFHVAVAALGPRDGRDVLLVDDAHLLDDPSAAAVHRLVARGVRLVLTVRSGEPVPTAVTDLWADDGAVRVDIAPLDPSGTAAVVAGALGGPVEPVTARRLHDTSGGNLLWLRHLVDGERAAGRLVRTAGLWAWSGDVELSPLLTDLVTARLGRLTPAQRHVLELLAVVEPLDLDLLERLAGSEAVEEVAERSLIALDPVDGEWAARHAHPLHGEAIRATTSPVRARRLRAELSDVLRTAGTARPGRDLRRAVLALDDGRTPDPGLMMAAARQASVLTDFGLAERLLRAAVRAGGGFDAASALAALLVYLLRADEADRVLAAAADAAATPEEVIRAVLLRCIVAHFGASGAAAVVGGETVLQEVEARAPDGPGERPEYDAVRSLMEGCRGELERSVPRAEAVLARAASTDDDVLLACWSLGYVRALTGTDRTRSLVDRGLAAATRCRVTGNYTGNLAFAEFLEAHMRGVPEDATARLTWARELPGEQAALWVTLYEGRLATAFGAPVAGVQALEGVLATFPGHGGGWAAWLLALVSQCHGMRGDEAAARRALDEAGHRRHPQLTVMEFELDLAEAWLEAAAGVTDRARDAARRGARRCADLELHAAEVLLLQTAVRFGDTGAGARLADLDALLDSPRSTLAAEHARVLGDGDPAALLDVAQRLEKSGMRPEAADAAAQAAALARGGGRIVLAAEAARYATEIATACDGLRTPALLVAEAPVGLSAREREIAHLAGEGLTNRQIAARLQVSVRTVESHVYRACTRLGLPDRAALAALAGPRPMQ